MNKNIKVLGIIPARGGSKGIPYKNIAPLNGQPLIYYTITAAQQAKTLDSFIVSTDNPKIAAVARSLGSDVPFLRPKKISGDKSTDIEFLRHAVYWLEKNRGWKPEIIVLLRPTTPFRTAADIDQAVTFMVKTNCDSVRTVSPPAPYYPHKMWVFKKSKCRGNAITPLLPTKYYNRLGTDVPRQWLPQVYWQNGVVDATKTKFIKAGRVYGPDIRGLVVETSKALDINYPDDIKLAEQILKNDGRNAPRPKPTLLSA